MMKIFVAVVCLATVVSTINAAVATCRSNGAERLIQFNGRDQDVSLPCDYWALKDQKCGNYLISLLPGNTYSNTKYYMDSLCVFITDTQTGLSWKGRTNNAMANEYYESGGNSDLYNLTLSLSDFTSPVALYLQISIFDHELLLEDRSKTFGISYIPWNPNNEEEFPNSGFVFQCFAENAVLNENPNQLCGSAAENEEEISTVVNTFQDSVITFDLNVTFLVDGNPQCAAARDLLLNTCQSEEQRREVINTCKDIIQNSNLTQCIACYDHDPMDIFNGCLKLGCTSDDFEAENEDLCAVVVDVIVGCREYISSENLTAAVESIECCE